MKEFNEDWQQAKCALLKPKVFFHIHTLIFIYYNKESKNGCFCFAGCKTKICKCALTGIFTFDFVFVLFCIIGCTTECGCCNCTNPVTVNPSSEVINTNINSLTVDLVNNLSVKKLQVCFLFLLRALIYIIQYICKENKINPKQTKAELINALLGKMEQELRYALFHSIFVLIFKFREYGDNEVDFEEYEYEYDNEGEEEDEDEDE